MNAQLDFVADKHREDILKPETEDSWERIAKGFVALKACCQDGQFSSTSEVVQTMRTFNTAINHAMLSERTRLSSAALDLVDTVASACEADFEALLPQFMPTLMILTGRTNKVVINRTKACILNIIDHTHSASLLPHFLNHLQEKSASMRLISAQCALAYLKCCNPPDIERESRAAEVESIIRKTAKDANADVRKVSREIFGAYRILLPARVDKFAAPLTPTIRKYLDIKTTVTSQASAKPPLPKMKSMTILASSKAPEKEKRPAPTHSRTNSATSTTERTTTRVERPTSSMASRPTRTQAPEKGPTRPELSRPALNSSGSGSGPSRVLSSSAEAPKQPIRSRVLPSSAAPQRPLSRTIPSNSTSTSLASSGPRRVPLPNPSQSTGPVVQARPPSRPVSKERNAAPSTSTRPASQQSRPIKPVAVPKVTSSTQASRAMLPPKTRADGTALGSAAPVRPGRSIAGASSAASSSAAEPTARPARVRTGLTQPTASQLAKVKALVITKAAPKKPSALPSKVAAKSTQASSSSNVLSKSLKANVSRPAEPGKTSKIAKRAVTPAQENLPAAAVPLPPSPEVASVPLPEPVECVVEDAVVTPPVVEEEEVAEPIEEEVVEPAPVEAEVEPEAEPEQHVPAPEPAHYHLPLLGPNIYVDGEELPNTPMHPELKSLGWNNAKTPISALLSSIQQGFEFSPSSPVSPPYTYLNGDKDTLPLGTQLF
ncbi:hypothetical protein D9611_000210 [Ephemerocybe angulata]|uniref:TOG domain-containing protein n=1 Tax=Ephemerocybe angulata TaxID=980116 RepID=A0A8H5BNL2_9AGAR|nr:hypothetical protein D9611_000210 [Tulosesus angulatus]